MFTITSLNKNILQFANGFIGLAPNTPTTDHGLITTSTTALHLRYVILTTEMIPCRPISITLRSTTTVCQRFIGLAPYTPTTDHGLITTSTTALHLRYVIQARYKQPHISLLT